MCAFDPLSRYSGGGLGWGLFQPSEQLPEGHTRIAPDLAAEVMSPNDLAYEVDRKVKEYLAAGVRLVWVINPDPLHGAKPDAAGDECEAVISRVR
jgi:Uma2 family endonuclease